MELIEAITVFGVLGVISTVIMLYIYRVVPQKSPKRQLERGLVDLQKTYSSTVEEILAHKSAHMKSIAAENNRLKKEMFPVDDDGQPVKESVPWETIAAGAEQMGIPSAVLLPFKKQILQYTKGMSIEEIQQAAKSFSGLLGGNRPQQNSDEQSGITYA